MLNFMEKAKNKNVAAMEDDEDLEFLRLAALKSLKKENVAASMPVKNIDDSHIIPVVSNVRPVVDKFYAAGKPEMVQPNLIHRAVPHFVNSGFEKMDINDTYQVQNLNLPLGPSFQYVPTPIVSTSGIADAPSNVQLSPRTAAFVYENKQIIKRRQGISPPHSPVAFRKSPGRWSRSPSPEAWKYRRISKSRSPVYPNQSPHFRNRSMSRSPQRRRHSPPPQPQPHGRRNRTRSPVPRNNFDGNAHRSERRSPVPNRRPGSPLNRHAARAWRGQSPQPQRDNGVHARKSGSPRLDDANHRKRRTRSPTVNAKSDMRRRTSSRSPIRKNARNNPNRARRTPPSKRFNNSNSNKPNHGGPRNRNYNGRCGSPSLNHRSHSPLNHIKRRSPPRTTAVNGEHSKLPNKETNLDRNDKQIETDSDVKKLENESNENDMKEKNVQQTEDELLGSSDSENSDSDNNDGIDLFASEESESENEGRFKLSSSKSERKANVPTVSFSELGKMAAAPADVLLRDLDELQTDSTNSHRRGGPRRDNDRNNRNRRDDRRYNRDRDRENRDRERDRGDRNRDRGREHESSKPRSATWKTTKNVDDARKKDESTSETANTKSDRKPILFKPTFTSIENENKTKTPDEENSTETKSRVTSEKRSAVPLKRPSKSNEKNSETKSLQSTVVGSTTIEKRTSPTTESTASTSKKPIHLRLGAMTKTWKTSKKTWRTEKVLSITV